MTVLITGATGTIGRPLVNTLAFRGVRVRAAGRSIQSRDFPARVDYVNADLNQPEALATALQGVDTLFVNPRAVGPNAAELLTLAADRGVRRFVALSAIDAGLVQPGYQPSQFNGDRSKEVEEAVVNSGLPWVCVRASSFATNVVGMFGAQIRAGDVVRGPYGTFAESLIHEADVVAVIAHVLMDDDLQGRHIEVTGPQSLTHEEMVGIIGEVIGRPLRFEEIPPEAAARELVANGQPEGFVTALMARYARGVGQPATVTDQVRRLIGSSARTFASWVADHAAAFRQLAS